MVFFSSCFGKNLKKNDDQLEKMLNDAIIKNRPSALTSISGCSFFYESVAHLFVAE